MRGLLPIISLCKRQTDRELLPEEDWIRALSASKKAARLSLPGQLSGGPRAGERMRGRPPEQVGKDGLYA